MQSKHTTAKTPKIVQSTVQKNQNGVKSKVPRDTGSPSDDFDIMVTSEKSSHKSSDPTHLYFTEKRFITYFSELRYLA